MKIVFQDCGKNYHRTWLFRHLNLELDLGNGNQPLRLAVLGGNGSGKSTLTLMISGQTNPTEGSIDWIDSHGKQIPSDSWYKHIALASPALEHLGHVGFGWLCLEQRHPGHVVGLAPGQAAAGRCGRALKTSLKPSRRWLIRE